MRYALLLMPMSVSSVVSNSGIASRLSTSCMKMKPSTTVQTAIWKRGKLMPLASESRSVKNP
jgi:hypothetical protein